MSTAPSTVRLYRAVALGHFGIDVFNSMGPVLLAFLSAPLGLSAAQVGLAVGLHQFLAGATQPAFGFLTDRIGSRIVGPLSVAWAIGFVAVATVMAERIGFPLFLLLFATAALGSGAFHPMGTMHAGQAVEGREASTTSIFFLCGQVGLSLGPFLAGLLLDLHGVGGIGALGLLFLLFPATMIWAMGSRRHNPRPVLETGPAGGTPRTRGSAWSALVLLLVFSGRAWIFIGTAAFLPLLFSQRGWSSASQGLVAGGFWLGGGLMGVLAGGIADRFGRRGTVAATTALGAGVLWLLPSAVGVWVPVTALLAGGLLGAPHSVLMVLAQDLLPFRRGLASGLALGYLFAMGAVASFGIGLLADRFELGRVLAAGAFVGLAVSCLALLLPPSGSRDAASAGEMATP